ncbi:ureidoglycolate hydrolase-like protein [Rhexocercosporidium sp. MPI-PUGE-AT-0058]|nr:ureidoglycolate hydrolase-like protein [Rhexocercosporidium sp. MPI-PUGE-AT-0058]
MPVRTSGPPRDIFLQPTPLTQSTFSPFGTVITNPVPTLIPSSTLTPGDLPPNAVKANQGSALKYLDVTHMLDLYSQAPSKAASKAVMNMFVCAPRALHASDRPGEGVFPVGILERHPYTTQTFIPLGISAQGTQSVRYLVIVAPSLPPVKSDEALPVPNGEGLPGRGLPDLGRLKTFIADGGQAVTYGAGTWHAPMVVIGKRAIDFVVVQFANGVGVEDCQEVEIGGGGRIGVVVPVVSKMTLKL